jgi:predicted alpha/beta hydrolase
MGRRALGAALLTVIAWIGAPRSGAASGPQDQFDAALTAIQALPYQAAYAPAGDDSAFSSNTVPVVNTPPAYDYTGGSIPGSDPTGASDTPPWPAAFHSVTITSTDGAQIQGMVDLQPGDRPAVLVVHGFNTHGYDSVIRWAAMLAANGYDVAAFDQRDYYFEYEAGEGYPGQLQTFGWKESQDVLAAGTWLSTQPGVTAVGVVGFSEGAQNTVLAMSQDTQHVFSAGITFSGPADQDTQIYSTAEPPNCSTPACTYPSTDVLIGLVVEPAGSYSDPCTVLSDAATLYGTTPYDILTHETPMHAQTSITVPLLNFYSADDSLVNPVQAQFMAAYEAGNPLQQTIEIQHGEHAYFFDRWWDQMAILTYFKDLLPTTASQTVSATVNQTAGGAPLSSQEVSLGNPTRASVDAQLAPYICDTSQPPPGLSSAPAANTPEGSPLLLAGAAGLTVAAGVFISRRRRRRVPRRGRGAA